jgi:glutathione S-transferase
MPTTKQCGTPSAANQAIGGVPTLHYYDWFSRGRGQVLRLLWEDAGIAYNDVRYTFDEFPSTGKKVASELNPVKSIPVVELNGKILVQSYAMLRKFARLLGKYDGETEDEKYWADAMCDVAIDCTSSYRSTSLGSN